VLERQAASLVRSGGGGVLETLLNADVSTVVERMEFVDVVMREQTDWVAETKAAGDAYEGLVEDITARDARSKALMSKLRTDQTRLKDKFAEAKQAILESGGLGSVDGLEGIAQVSGGLACPVESPVSFINSWGFARSGGRHHQGTDMMAALGATVFAMADGVVTKTQTTDSGLSGRQVMIRHPGGVDTWYFHLQTVKTAKGQKVSAGDVIGTNGSSGNAQEGAEHVHFEYHVNGSAVNPYPFLDKACPEH
jgi:murein DD-endopeptidase MepM/ murein hydrolase activator NlpD